MSKTPRQIAFDCLTRNESSPGFLEDALAEMLDATTLDSRDRGLAMELCYGVVRWRAPLDWLIAGFTDGRPQRPDLQNLLRLGVYQLFWLDRIPEHAAVFETVEMARRSGVAPKAGFLNAVLRRFTRERTAVQQKLESLKTLAPALAASHPKWMYDRAVQRWGLETTQKWTEWNNQPAQVYARINLLKVTPTTLAAIWKREGVEATPVEADWLGTNQVFQLTQFPSLKTLGSFRDGFFYLQDPSTLLAVKMLQPTAGDVVLDACAAPGGKSACIAEIMQNKGTVLAEDTTDERLRLIKQNIERLGASCVKAGLAQSLQDSTPNKILVDAPCSNTGVMRRRIELRWRLQPAIIPRMAEEQLVILNKVSSRLAPGGSLVYSTCSLEEEENRGVVNKFLATHPDFKLEVERELHPVRDHVDGAYSARMVKEKQNR